MSLSSLMKNFFSVATDQFAGVDSEGAVDRDYHLTLLTEFQNKRCNIQGVSKRDVVEIFGKKEDASILKLFHTQYNLDVKSSIWILTHKNPRKQITDFTDRANLLVYQYVGQRDPVQHTRKRVPLEIYLEKNDRWHL